MELKTFGERLHWARHVHAKLTQQQLRDRMKEAYGVEIGRNYISILERATAEEEESDTAVRPNFKVVMAMAGVLKVSMDFLAGFTENIEPTVNDGVEAATYFSEEADEAARIVDDMRPDQRALAIAVMRNMAIAGNDRARREAEAMDVLDSVERDKGIIARQDLERIFREKGLLKSS